MMSRSNPWDSYRKVATQTATPGQLVLMLFDGSLRFLERALEGFACQDPLERNLAINNNVRRAQAIVNELNVTLNMEMGGEVALNLRRLYTYFEKRLQMGNIRKEREPIQEVASRLRLLRDSWAEMLQQGRGGYAGPAVEPPAHLAVAAAA